jgi:hypothetical protein
MIVKRLMIGAATVPMLFCLPVWFAWHLQSQELSTSTEGRDGEKNIHVVRELNRAWEQLPFSHEFDGVLDHPPLKLDWRTGPNLPTTWKGGTTTRA